MSDSCWVSWVSRRLSLDIKSESVWGVFIGWGVILVVMLWMMVMMVLMIWVTIDCVDFIVLGSPCG